MKKSILKSIQEVRSLGHATFKSEQEAYALAKAVWPLWMEYQEQYFIYEYCKWPDTKESGYLHARLGIGGYESAQLLTLVKRGGIYPGTKCQLRYELVMPIEDGAGHFCTINLETGAINAGINWPHPLPGQQAKEVA